MTGAAHAETEPVTAEEAWLEGFEAAGEWIANNPGPSGNPVDPPRNPYGSDRG